MEFGIEKYTLIPKIVTGETTEGTELPNKENIRSFEEKENYFNLGILETDTIKQRCLWCNGYRPWKWTRRHEFKSWPRIIAFHIALIPLGKV